VTHVTQEDQDPALRILSDALLEVLGEESQEATLFKLSRRMQEGSAAAVRPYFDGLSAFEKKACLIRAQQLAFRHRG
jgi:hypothetical protein